MLSLYYRLPTPKPKLLLTTANALLNRELRILEISHKINSILDYQ